MVRQINRYSWSIGWQRPDGSWLGEGIGSVKESKFWYKEAIFPSWKKEIILFAIGQAVRNNGEARGR